MGSGFIFDIDGTLIDSVDLHAQAWQETLAGAGLKTIGVLCGGFRGVFHARPANSLVSVCTFTFSPSLIKSGT